MKVFSCVIAVFFVESLVSGISHEQFDESAWMDTQGRDKYFEYTDVSSLDAKPRSYSNNIDVVEFELPKKLPSSHHAKQHTNVIDLFFNTIRKAASSNEITRPENETSKGLDMKLPVSSQNALPNFGNQDLQLIAVGTKWCGAGNIAKNKRDIGYFYHTDACCREHDLCPMALGAQEVNYGLKNSGKFTRSHCDCDEQFYQCLKSVNTFVSKQVGMVYFNLLGPQCFKEHHPQQCTKTKRGRCVSYSRDETKPKHFQWIDNKFF